MNNLKFTLETLKTAKLGLEAMIEEERCGDTFIATALTLDRIKVNIMMLEMQIEHSEKSHD